MDNKQISITELDQYISSSKIRLEKILATLNWTIEDSLKESTCSKSNEDKTSYNNDPFLPDSFGWKNSVVIDQSQLQSILNKNNVAIPEKFSDIQLNFSREQKSELYNYVIANTEKTCEPELKVLFPNDVTDNSLTFAEIVAKAKKKDKQLQRKYRTSKPTHIEEVRNLVHLQMQALDKYFNPQSEETQSCSSYRGQGRTSGISRCRDNLESDRKKSRNFDKDIQNKLNEIRNRSTTSHHKNRDKREDTMRSRSTDRSNRLQDKRSSLERKKHNNDRRSGEKDETSVERIKKKRKRSKSPKSKKKHKHHRNHSSTK